MSDPEQVTDIRAARALVWQQLVKDAYRLRQWVFASVALSAVAFVVSLVSVFL